MYAAHLVSPIADPWRPRRLVKVGSWLVGIAALLLVLDLLGVEVAGWIGDL